MTQYLVEGKRDTGYSAPVKFQIYVTAQSPEEAKRKFWSNFDRRIVEEPRTEFTIETITEQLGRR